MAVKRILTIPDEAKILRTRAEPVALTEPSLAALLADLHDTLLRTPHAVGLAAPQIGVLKRVFVLRRDFLRDDLAADSRFWQQPDEVMVFINPKIISRKGLVREDEGCLSIPGRYYGLERAAAVKVRAQDTNGEQFYERFSGLASRAVQQEIDHLDGVLICDRARQ